MIDAAKPQAASDGESLPGLVLSRALATPGRTIMRAKRLGIWKETSGAEFTRAVADCAAGLAALGLKKGEVAGILAAPSPDWAIADLGIQSAGAVAAGFHAEAAPGELAAIVKRCVTRVLFVDTATALDAALDLRDAGVGVEIIVCFDPVAIVDVPDAGVMTFEALLANGAAAAGRNEAPWRALGASDNAAIIPTSGVSAPARPAQFTHRALGAAVDSGLSMLDLRDGDERLSLMQASHPLERVLGFYACFAAGVVVNFPESAETALANLRELQPQVVIGPPAFWSGIAKGVARASAGATGLQRRLFEAAMRSSGPMANFAVLRKVRADLGFGRTRLAVSGGAPLSPHTRDQLTALGVAISDVYATAETAGAIASATSTSREFASARGVEIGLDPSGAVRVRSAALFGGYVGDPARVDDWHATADFGTQARAGAFSLFGSSEAVPQSRGDAFSSWPAEDALAASPYVASCAISGAHPAELTAIVLIDYDNVVRYAQARSTPFTHFKSLIQASDVRSLIEQEIAGVNDRIAPARIAHFVIADRPVAAGDPVLGPALNLRRRLAAQSFAIREN